MTRVPELITEANAKQVFWYIDNPHLTNHLIGLLNSTNKPLGLKIFQNLCTSNWQFPVNREDSKSGPYQLYNVDESFDATLSYPEHCKNGMAQER